MEDGLDDKGISVTGDFEEVFSGVGVRIRPKSKDNLIEFFVLESDVGGLRRTRGYRFARKLLGDATGFGARYAGGCTSGHAISGLSNLQIPSLIAVIGFFAGGLIMTYFFIPLIF